MHARRGCCSVGFAQGGFSALFCARKSCSSLIPRGLYTCQENTKTRRNGDVRYSIRYHVRFHVGSPSPQRDTFLSKRTVGSKFWLHSNCHNPSLRGFNTRRYTLLSRRRGNFGVPR